jgi:hypothetical protein
LDPIIGAEAAEADAMLTATPVMVVLVAEVEALQVEAVLTRILVQTHGLTVQVLLH